MSAADDLLKFAVGSIATVVAAGIYWGEDRKPLSYVKVAAVEKLWAQPGELAETIGDGLDCGMCSGQYVAFGVTAVMFKELRRRPLAFLTVATAMNGLNVLAHRRGWVGRPDDDEIS